MRGAGNSAGARKRVFLSVLIVLLFLFSGVCFLITVIVVVATIGEFGFRPSFFLPWFLPGLLALVLA